MSVFAPKNFGLSDSLIAAARGVHEGPGSAKKVEVELTEMAPVDPPVPTKHRKAHNIHTGKTSRPMEYLHAAIRIDGKTDHTELVKRHSAMVAYHQDRVEQHHIAEISTGDPANRSYHAHKGTEHEALMIRSVKHKATSANASHMEYKHAKKNRGVSDAMPAGY